VSSIVADLPSLPLDGFQLEWRRRADGNSNARIELDTPKILAWSGKLESNKRPPFW
jgi:hypothetical protein